MHNKVKKQINIYYYLITEWMFIVTTKAAQSCVT